MTIKDQLQKELLEKVKKGVKPSDFKKQKENIFKTFKTTQDEGYESDGSIPIPPPPPPKLEKQKSQDYEHILEKHNPDKEIIKVLEAKIKEQEQIIEELKKQVKNKPTKEIGTQTEPTFFYCDSCQLNKKGTYTIRKVDAPFEPRLHGRVCYLCADCAKYTKELNDTTFDKENNPYKFY